MTTRLTYLALGSNLPGIWGAQPETLLRATTTLGKHVGPILSVSKTYKSPSLSAGQPAYFNLVLACETRLGPTALLRVLKRIERSAGRRPRGRWSARPLDIDIVMTGWQSVNWSKRVSGTLSLPHPECHLRAFVLKPLLDIAPHWTHPILGVPAKTLLEGLPVQQRGFVRAI
jgi:2-amino-4-hydroxy-6-hydroxymethyldihydropteridine diphosphokinase